MNALIISQTIFYIVGSITMIVIGVMLTIVIYYLICILKNTRNLSRDLKETYFKTKASVEKFIGIASSIKNIAKGRKKK